MTNPDSSPKQRLVAVPPNRIKRDQQSPTTKPQPVQPSIPEKKSNNLGWWITGSIIVICGAISFIPVKPNVRADAWLEPDPEARQPIYAPEGKVVEIRVKPGDEVVENQPLVVLENRDLDEEIKGWDFRRLENQVEIETTQQSILTARARLNSTQANISIVQQRVDQLQTELNGLNNGVLPPEIAGYETQIISLKQQADSMQTTINRYLELKAENAIADVQIENLERQKFAIEAQIGEFQSAKGAVERRLRDDLARKQEQLAQLQNSSQVAMQEYQAAQNAVNSRLPIEDALVQEISERVERREDEKVIVSPIAGKVITENLYLLENRTLEKGMLLLEIADTKQLIAKIEVTQEDRDLVQEGAVVTFNSPELSISSFKTKITKITDVIEPDKNLKKSIVTFKAEIDNTSGQLQPGARMYARIESPEKITLGQQAWRQIVNLLKIRSL